jgi:hypothetical protein
MVHRLPEAKVGLDGLNQFPASGFAESKKPLPDHFQGVELFLLVFVYFHESPC